MTIGDIKISDILEKKLWRVVAFDDTNLGMSQVEEIQKIAKTDVVLHPALIVEKKVAVHPVLVSKFYEDGGEVGEYLVYFKGIWEVLDDRVNFQSETEPVCYGLLSTLDIHEYQKGSFDNRKDHYARFDFYSNQIDSKHIFPFPEISLKLPTKVTRLSSEEQIVYLRECIIEAVRLQKDFRVAKGNKKVDEAFALTELIKSSAKGRSLLRTLLADSEKSVRLGMMYQLRDIYQNECVSMLKKLAKEDSLEGMVARMNLNNPKFLDPESVSSGKW